MFACLPLALGLAADIKRMQIGSRSALVMMRASPLLLLLQLPLPLPILRMQVLCSYGWSAPDFVPVADSTTLRD
jgi:hypothetical protein